MFVFCSSPTLEHCYYDVNALLIAKLLFLYVSPRKFIPACCVISTIMLEWNRSLVFFFTHYPRKILKVFARYKADKTSKFTRCTVTRCRPAKLKNYTVTKFARLKGSRFTMLQNLQSYKTSKFTRSPVHKTYKRARPTRTGKKISIIDVSFMNKLSARSAPRDLYIFISQVQRTILYYTVFFTFWFNIHIYFFLPCKVQLHIRVFFCINRGFFF